MTLKQSDKRDVLLLSKLHLVFKWEQGGRKTKYMQIKENKAKQKKNVKNVE